MMDFEWFEALRNQLGLTTMTSAHLQRLFEFVQQFDEPSINFEEESAEEVEHVVESRLSSSLRSFSLDAIMDHLSMQQFIALLRFLTLRMLRNRESNYFEEVWNLLDSGSEHVTRKELEWFMQEVSQMDALYATILTSVGESVCEPVYLRSSLFKDQDVLTYDMWVLALFESRCLDDLKLSHTRFVL